MTLETVTIEKCRSYDTCQPTGTFDLVEICEDHILLDRKDQCSNCPWSGPVVEAQWEYVDPRLTFFERLLEKLAGEEFVGEMGDIL